MPRAEWSAAGREHYTDMHFMLNVLRSAEAVRGMVDRAEEALREVARRSEMALVERMSRGEAAAS